MLGILENLPADDTARFKLIIEWKGFKGAAVYAGQSGYGQDFVRENWNDWGPRAGFALLLTSDGKTVARGDDAIYYPITAQNAYMQGAGSSNGFGITQQAGTRPQAMVLHSPLPAVFLIPPPLP